MTSRQLAAHLIATKRAQHGADVSGSFVAALSVEDLYVALSRWVGIDGCHALFSRALADAEPSRPLLQSIQLNPRGDIRLDGVSSAAAEHGEAETAAAIEETIVRTIDLLGRLIGSDMTANLIERGLPDTSRDNTQQNKRAEA